MRNNLGFSLVDSWMDKLSKQKVYEFDDFRLDATHLILSCDGEEMEMAPKAVETLVALIERRGEVMSKDELLETVWPDTIVDESNLFAYLSHIRKALGVKKDGTPYIETLRRRGYRFTGKVSAIPARKPALQNGSHGIASIPRSIQAPVRLSSDSGRFVLMASLVDRDPDVPEVAAATQVQPVAQVHAETVGTEPMRIRRPVLISLIVGILLFSSIGLYRWSGNPSPGPESERSVAVLPFRSIGADAGNDYLEMGMADSVISKLSSTGEIIVRPLSSVKRFVDSKEDVQSIGRRLGVNYVLEGSTQNVDGKVRLSARLIRVENGHAVWAKQFDASSNDILEVQNVIAEMVAAELHPYLSANARIRMNKHGTDDPEAYALYERGRRHVEKLTFNEIEKGISYLTQAIDRDPSYASAYAELSNAYRSMALGGNRPAGEVLPRAKHAALKALEIDDRSAYAHIMAGHSAMWYDRDWKEAEERAQHALALEPNNPAAFYLLQNLYSFLGRHEEAIEFGRKARELAPLTPIYNSLETQTLLYAGRVDEALERALKTPEEEKNFWHVHLMLARIYTEKKMYAEAIVEADKAAKLSGDHSYDLAVKACALARSGDAKAARAILEDLAKRTENGRYHTSLALVHTALGEKDKAIEHLEAGFAARESQLELKVAPGWNDLRAEPRFIELLNKLGF